MKLHFTFLLLFPTLSCHFAFSQVTPRAQQAVTDLGNMTQYSTSTIVNLPGSSDSNYDIIGSRYFNEDFAKGSIKIFNKDNLFRDLEMIYNIYDNTLVVKQRDQKIQLNNNDVYQFTIEKDGKDYEFYNAKKFGKELINTFLLKQQTVGDFTIFTRFIKNQTVKNAAEEFGTDRNEIIYTDNNIHYIYNGNELIESYNIKNLKKFNTSINNVKIKKRRLDKVEYLVELLNSI